MSRAARNYTAQTRALRRFEGIDVTEPRAGFYRCRLVSGGVRGGVKIWFGPPKDPVTGEVMDRSLRWQAEFEGDPIDLDRVWPDCAGDPITEEEYVSYCRRVDWARQHAPNSAYAQRTRRLDPLSADTPLPF